MSSRAALPRAFAAFAIVALFALPIAAPPKAPGISDAARAELSRFLQDAVDRHDVPGVVALVTSPERELYLEAFGEADVAQHRAMTPDAMFRLASMTKPITSVAAMMLFDQGLLGLDDPLVRYLPDHTQPEVLESFDAATGKATTRPARGPITIRQLLTHTSGIGYLFDDPALAAMAEKGVKDADLPLVHDPGEKWTYGSSTQLLGRVVERQAGRLLDDFFQTRIFGPLGMSDTFYRVPDEKRGRLVTRHQRKDGRLTETPNASGEASTVRGDGGLASTAHDYGAFLRMLLNGGSTGRVRLLRQRTVTLMTENQIGKLTVRRMPAAIPALALSFPNGAGRDTFGFGFQIAAAGTSARSRGSYSWGGIYNTHFWVDPQRRVGVVLLMQVLPFYDEACMRIVAGFEDRLYRGL